MEITEVRVRLVTNKDDRLRAFCSMILDGEFLVRDIKVIENTDGYFVAMPSRKISDRCAKCGGKNPLGAKFCSSCGRPLPEPRVRVGPTGRTRLHEDVAHPISAACRQQVQDALLTAYRKELEKSKQPGYRPVGEELDDASGKNH